MQACWRAFALATSVVVAGCSSGSSGNGPDCTMFTACGGNVVGTWRLTKACISGVPNPFAKFCPTSTFQVYETLNGTVQFVADDGVTLAMGAMGGTYSSNLSSSSAVEDFTIPASCLQGVTCAQFQSSINQSGDGGVPAAMGTCTDAAGGCACHITGAGSATATKGVYSVSGTTITIDGQPGPYCVKGSGLLIQNPTMISTMMMTVGGTFTLAATRE